MFKLPIEQSVLSTFSVIVHVPPGGISCNYFLFTLVQKYSAYQVIKAFDSAFYICKYYVHPIILSTNSLPVWPLQPQQVMGPE